MIEGIAKNVAALSLLAFMYAAAFNIGYFAAFGLHFIGVMDVSNFVYSFAFLLIFFAALVVMILLATNLVIVGPDFWKASYRAGYGFAVMAVALTASYVSFRNYSAAIVLLVTSYVCAVVAGMAPIYGYWRKTNRLKIQWIAVLFIGSLLALALVGRAFGEQQKLSSRHYTISTKSGNVTGAVMLRASSNGFLISINGQVQYISASEIKSVTEESSRSH